MIIFTMATANITFEMAISFFSNIIIPLISALSLGKIIQIWVENKYKQSKKISHFEEDLITIYSNIYFSLITDPVTNKLHKESSEMLTELFLYLQQHKEFSIYFDEKTLTLLKPFNPDSTPSKKRIHFLKKKKSNNEAAIFKKRIERKY